MKKKMIAVIVMGCIVLSGMLNGCGNSTAENSQKNASVQEKEKQEAAQKNATSEKTKSSGSSSSSHKKPSTGNANHSYKSYDEGYDAIYDDDDYDWNRYQTDRDYANGVDDAMDDWDDEYGEDW